MREGELYQGLALDDTHAGAHGKRCSVPEQHVWWCTPGAGMLLCVPVHSRVEPSSELHRWRGFAAMLAAGMLLPGCSDVVVGYFSGTESTSSGTSPGADSSDPTTATLGTTLGSGGETTGGGFLPPGCFSDDFADGVVDEPHWSTWAEADAYLEEVAGELRLTPPTYGLYDTGVVGRFDHQFPFDSGWARLRVVTAPPVDDPAGLFLMVGDPPDTLSIRLAGGNLQVAGAIDEQLVFEELFPLTPYPSWIGIRGEGSVAHFEVSMDGQSWSTLATHDKPGAFDEAAALIMVQTFGDYPDRATVAVDDLEVCIQ